MSYLKRYMRRSCERLLAHSPEKIRELTEPYPRVTFDVFDTLIYRDAGDPDDVFKIVGEKLGLQDTEFGSYPELRRRAETIARRSTDKEEIGYRDIFHELERLLPCASPALIGQLASEELITERGTLRAREDMRAVFEHTRSSKRVSLVSDMYLERTFVEDALIACGYCLDGVRVYVSSEYGLTKRSGRLFRKVADDDSDVFCHVGDNLLADWMAPRKLGLSAYLVRNHSANAEAAAKDGYV